MDRFSSRPTRPGVPQQQLRSTEPEPVAEPPHGEVPHTSTVSFRRQEPLRRFSRRTMMIVGGLIALLIAACLGWMVYQATIGNVIKGDKYQAVFLSNGQVYFGKLQRVNNEYYRLTSVFYLQTKSTTSDAKNPQTSDSNGVELIKLGGELHGPDDEMMIERTQVLFFENLKADGKVSQTIKEYNDKNK